MPQTLEYKKLIITFEKWLTTLEYAKSTIYCSVNYVRDFLQWIEKNNHTIRHLAQQNIQQYQVHLQQRSNKRHGGSLSKNYIISNINALKRFARYLKVTGKPGFEVDVEIEREQVNEKQILTPQEINKLYTTCENNNLGQRDRAMLSIFYGCGLRRSEGVNLDVKDINITGRLVHVRHGKNYRQRYVPMSNQVTEHLQHYIHNARAKMLETNYKKQDALFTSYRATRLCGNTLTNSLQKLIKTANINKTIGLHSLRHSIATHLLQSGMPMEDVSRFLGHKSLESTQIYTRVVNFEF